MAVYTKLSTDDFALLLQNYDIGQLVSFKEIADGVSNSNYLLETTNNRYIATIYEDSAEGEVSLYNLQFYWSFMEHLEKCGISCPLPIYNKNGDVLQDCNGHPFAIVSFLQGAWPKTIKNHHCSEVGRHLAHIHIASQSFSQSLDNPSSVLGLPDFFDNFIQKSALPKNISTEIQQSLEIIINNYPAKNIIPSGVIHADLFPDNVFFQGDKLSGILDFYLSCNDFFAYDAAIAINAWCFEYETEFNLTKAKNFLKSYNSVRQFSDSELEYLPILAAGAAMRFYLRRLYDVQNSDKNSTNSASIANLKNPNEYLQKLRFHLKVKTYKEYGL